MMVEKVHSGFIATIVNLHGSVFGWLEKNMADCLVSILARLVFLGVLFFYFFNSFFTKVGEGFAGFFQIETGAYFQIITEKGLALYDFDTDNVPFYLDAVVYLGTYFELILPILIVIGLFTRISALGMIIFIAVQSYVDIYLHQVEAATIGKWFDHISSSVIMDQRALWLFLLLVLVLRGGGVLSLDHLLGRRLR